MGRVANRPESEEAPLPGKDEAKNEIIQQTREGREGRVTGSALLVITWRRDMTENVASNYDSGEYTTCYIYPTVVPAFVRWFRYWSFLHLWHSASTDGTATEENGKTRLVTMSLIYPTIHTMPSCKACRGV